MVINDAAARGPEKLLLFSKCCEKGHLAGNLSALNRRIWKETLIRCLQPPYLGGGGGLRFAASLAAPLRLHSCKRLWGVSARFTEDQSQRRAELSLSLPHLFGLESDRKCSKEGAGP